MLLRILILLPLLSYIYAQTAQQQKLIDVCLGASGTLGAVTGIYEPANSCFVYVKSLPFIPATYSTASGTCGIINAAVSSMGARCMIGQLLDQATIANLTAQGVLSSSMSAWVNLQQTTTTNEPAGGWQWIEIDGSASNPITPIPWIPGQPDNSGGAQNQGVYIGASSGISDEKQSSFTPTGTFCQCLGPDVTTTTSTTTTTTTPQTTSTTTTTTSTTTKPTTTTTTTTTPTSTTTSTTTTPIPTTTSISTTTTTPKTTSTTTTTTSTTTKPTTTTTTTTTKSTTTSPTTATTPTATTTTTATTPVPTTTSSTTITTTPKPTTITSSTTTTNSPSTSTTTTPSISSTTTTATVPTTTTTTTNPTSSASTTTTIPTTSSTTTIPTTSVTTSKTSTTTSMPITTSTTSTTTKSAITSSTTTATTKQSTTSITSTTTTKATTTKKPSTTTTKPTTKTTMTTTTKKSTTKATTSTTKKITTKKPTTTSSTSTTTKHLTTTPPVQSACSIMGVDPDVHLCSSARSYKVYSNVTDCATKCAAETNFTCRAFVWKGSNSGCVLHGKIDEPVIMENNSQWFLVDLDCAATSPCYWPIKATNIDPTTINAPMKAVNVQNHNHCQVLCLMQVLQPECWAYALSTDSAITSSGYNCFLFPALKPAQFNAVATGKFTLYQNQCKN